MGIICLCAAAVFLVRDDLIPVQWNLPVFGGISALVIMVALSSLFFFSLARRAEPE